MSESMAPERILEAITTASVQARIGSLENEALENQAKMEALAGDARRIDAELRIWREVLSYRERTSPPAAARIDSEPMAASADRDNGTPPPTLRQAVTALLRSEPRDWPAAEIRRRFANSGLITADEKGGARLYATLSDMAKRGELSKAAYGSYRLPLEEVV